MKAVRRTTCSCGYDNWTGDGKKVQKCPKCGGTLKLSNWYARGKVAGKQVKYPCGPLKTDAEDYIAACRLAKRAGTVLPGREKDITWKEAVENCEGWWDKEVERGKMKKSTRERHYAGQIITLNKFFAGMTLLTITKTTVEQFMDSLRDTHAPATICHAVKCLKRMYTLHTMNLDLENNPRPKLIEKAFIINTVELPEVDNEITASCTDVDFQAVLALLAKSKGHKLDKQRLHLAIMLGIGMLLRPININSLEWTEVDLDAGIVRIPKAKMKGKRDFEKPIPAVILAELKAWRDTYELHRIEKGYDVSPFVFPSPKDHMQPMNRMSKAVTSWIKKAGLNADGVDRKNKITPYVLTRHTGATELYEESGENLELVSKTADHADSRITRRRYVKNRVEFTKRTVIPIQEAMLKRMVGGTE